MHTNEKAEAVVPHAYVRAVAMRRMHAVMHVYRPRMCAARRRHRSTLVERPPARTPHDLQCTPTDHGHSRNTWRGCGGRKKQGEAMRGLHVTYRGWDVKWVGTQRVADGSSYMHRAHFARLARRRKRQREGAPRKSRREGNGAHERTRLRKCRRV